MIRIVLAYVLLCAAIAFPGSTGFRDWAEGVVITMLLSVAVFGVAAVILWLAFTGAGQLL